MRLKTLLFVLALLGGLVASATPVWAGCYCSGQDMDNAAAPLEGLIALPSDSCSNESRSMWLTDEDGVGVAGSFDDTIEDFPLLDTRFWRAEAPLTPGASYTYHHVVKDSTRGFNSYGCETTATLTMRDEPFGEVAKPLAEMSELVGNWVPHFQCYAPRYWVTVTKNQEDEPAAYYRYTMSVVRGEEVNPVKWQLGGPPETFDHYADWAVNWRGGAPFQDEYCIRVDAWEIVNGTRSTEDLCVLTGDLIGAPTSPGAPDEVVPEDATLCGPSIDVTQPFRNRDVPDDPDDPEASTGGGGGCSQGGGAGGLPIALLSLILSLGALRLRPRQV